jgi:hypothetical protein
VIDGYESAAVPPPPPPAAVSPRTRTTMKRSMASVRIESFICARDEVGLGCVYSGGL